MSDLRKRAKEILDHQQNTDDFDKYDLAKLIEELNTYQIELELQNDELSRTNEMLSQSKRQFMDLYENAPVAYFTLDQKSLILDLNFAGAKMVRKSRLSVINSSFSHLIHKDDLIIFNHILNECNKHNLDLTTELKLNFDDELYFIKLNLAPYFDRFYNARLIRAIAINITEKKLQAIELKESEEKYRSLFENSSDAILTIEDYQITSCNWAAVELFEYKTKYDLINQRLESLFPDFQPDGTESNYFSENNLNKVHDIGVLKFECYNIKSNGEIFPADIWLTSLRINDTNIIHCNIRDLSEKRNAETALKESEELYKLLIKNMEEAVLLVDPEGHVIEYNESAEKILDVDYIIKENTIDKYDRVIIDENYNEVKVENYPAYKTILNHESVKDVIWGINKTDGTISWAKLTSDPIYFSDSEKPYALVTISDITKLKEKEQALKNIISTKDKFLSILSHDLRSPFQAITGYTMLIEEAIKNKCYNELTEYSQILSETASQTFGLLNNLLQWSYTQIGGMEFCPVKFHIKEFIEDIRSLIKKTAAQKNIEVDLNIDFDNELIADRVMLDTIVRNLLSNAIKFTNIGGNIKLNVSEKDEFIVFSIIDNGVGIESDSLKNLFSKDLYKSTPGTNKEQGSGIGLKLCKEFIDKHQGDIWVKSEKGKGSEFTFAIPKRY